MAHTIRVDLNKGTNYLITSGTLKYNERFGQAGAADVSVTLTEGNAANQANQTFASNYTLAAGAVLHLDLRNGTGSPLDVLNTALSLATVKLLIVSIDNPAANNVLTLGPSANTPAGNAAGAPLWLGNGTMNETIHQVLVKASPVQGWTVSSGAGNLIIKNAGNQTCQFTLRITGVRP